MPAPPSPLARCGTLRASRSHSRWHGATRFRPNSQVSWVARRAPLQGAWRSQQSRTRRAIPHPPSCTGSSETKSRRSAPAPRRCATARASRALSNGSFATSSGADVWPVALRVFGARPADKIGWSPSRARVGAFVPRAAVAGVPLTRRALHPSYRRCGHHRQLGRL